MKNPYLIEAEKFGLGFSELDLIANKAVKVIKKSYSYLGALTPEDLYSTAWLGILSAVSKPKFLTAKNKHAYCFVFASGYCRHALHRKSRMVRLPYSALQKNPSGSAHLSYTWDNLPEPQAEIKEQEFSLEQLQLAAEIPTCDKKRLLAGQSITNPKTKEIVQKLLCAN